GFGDQRGERVREREAEQRRSERVPHRLREDLGVDRLAEKAYVAVEVEIEPSLLEERRQAAEFARGAERRQHHDQRRDREEQQQIGERRPADQPLADARSRCDRDGLLSHRHSSMKWPASTDQLISTASPTSKNLARPLCELASSASTRMPPGVATRYTVTSPM